MMECSIDYDYEYNWLKVITKGSKRTVHPIRHLAFEKIKTELEEYILLKTSGETY